MNVSIGPIKHVDSRKPLGSTVYLQRINFLSVIPALLLSLRCRIHVWKMPNMFGLERRFERLKPYELFSRDEWLQLHEDCFDSWRATVLPNLQISSRPPKIKAGLLSVDFSIHLWQMLGTEYERAMLFLSIARRHAYSNEITNYRISEPPIFAVVGHEEQATASPQDIERRPILRAIECLNEWLLSGAYLARLVIGTFRRILTTSLNFDRRPYVWRGISPREVPAIPGKVDFAWAVHYGFIEAGKAIFFLPSKPTKAQRNFLRDTGVATVEPLDEFRLVGRVGVLSNLLDTARGLLQAVSWRLTFEGAWLAQLIVRGLIWSKIATAVSAKWYLTTTSASWPERAELAVLKPCGVRCITWAYSANSLTFAWNRSTFRDLGVERSLLSTDEFWVWNRAFKKWLEDRNVCRSSPGPNIKVVGPMMCGDGRLMTATVAGARSRIKLPAGQFIVGVFDMPAISVQWKQRHGGGPSMVEPEYYAGFFRGILRVLQEVPDIGILLKLKRTVDDWSRQFPPELERLLQVSQPGGFACGRVHLVDVDVDPYLPVACSDMTIGMPYTSPVLAGLSMGKPGCYYDPGGIANRPSEPALRLITLQDPEALVTAVQCRGVNLVSGNLLANITPPALNPMFLREI